MHLEVVIAENTAAIRELIALMKSGAPLTVAQQADQAIAATAATEVATKPRASRKAAEPKAEPAAPAVVTEPEAPKAEVVTYEQAAKAITALIQRKGKPTAVALLAKFGVTKLPEAKPEQFAEIVTACTEA